MRKSCALVSAILAGCVGGETGPVAADPDEIGAGPDGGGVDGPSPEVPDVPDVVPDVPEVPDLRCAGAPDAGEPGPFRHFTSGLISALGDPKHRGFDLVASASSATQTLEGWISYTVFDKALEDENVDVFACMAGQWQRVGTARTDDEGHFALGLSSTGRLPIGMRDLFVSVVGDRTGAPFLAYVAPEGSRLVVSDVDGTLTSSENAFLETVVFGTEPDAHPGAAQAFSAAAGRGGQLVYVTARGNQFTTATRDWLEHEGFPRGPVRLAPSFVTLPGDDTVAYKTQTISALAAAGLALSAGVGNRASDITAYASTGVAADRIFIKLPEFTDEVQAQIDAGQAVGFTSYDEIAGEL